jgi:hypothetical protein
LFWQGAGLFLPHKQGNGAKKAGDSKLCCKKATTRTSPGSKEAGDSQSNHSQQSIVARFKPHPKTRPYQMDLCKLTHGSEFSHFRQLPSKRDLPERPTIAFSKIQFLPPRLESLISLSLPQPIASARCYRTRHISSHPSPAPSVPPQDVEPTSSSIGSWYVNLFPTISEGMEILS